MPDTYIFDHTADEAVDLWLRGLRSGDYKQGKHFLCKINADRGFEWCCLGVACDLYDQFEDHLLDLDDYDGADEGEGFRCYGFGDCHILPEEVQVWLGLSTSVGSFIGGSLSSRNDDREDSFGSIADLIESRPAELFMSEDRLAVCRLSVARFGAAEIDGERTVVS